MQKRLVALVVVLLVFASLGAFAAEKKSADIPWLVSYNSPGTTDLMVTAGWVDLGVGAQAALSLTFGDFNIGPVPLSWGVTVVGNVGVLADLEIGAGAFVSLDWGVDFGASSRFEGQIGIGPGIALSLGGYSFWTSPFGIGIGEYNSWTWWFSNNFGLNFQDVWVNTFAGLYSPNLYGYTLGVDLKL